MEAKDYKLLTAEPTEEMLDKAITDEFGAKYSPDGKVLYVGPEDDVDCYKVKNGTEVIADHAFAFSFGSHDVVEVPGSVVAIGGYCFSNTEVKEVRLSEGLKSIGEMCFHHCNNLSAIHIPDTVEYLGEWAFEECGNLERVHLSTALTSLGMGLFSCCHKLKEVNIHSGLQSFGAECFQGCSQLTSIHIPDGVTEISFLTFDGCINLQDLILPDSVKAIGDSAFWGCKLLDSFTLPKDLNTMGANPFGGTKIKNIICQNENFTFNNGCLYEGNKLISYLREGEKCVVVDDGVEIIGSEAFTCREEIEKIVLPETVHTICKYAFMNMDGLVSVRVPKNLRSVEKYAFNGCKELVPFDIPESATGRRQRIFYQCKGTQFNLRKLLDRVPFEDVAPALKDYYKLTDSDMPFFQEAYRRLKYDIVPSEGDGCCIQLCMWSRTNPVVRVIHCGGEPWENILLREIIVRQEFIDLTDAEVLAHILWEATYYEEVYSYEENNNNDSED